MELALEIEEIDGDGEIPFHKMLKCYIYTSYVPAHDLGVDDPSRQ